jgi:phosphoribosylanthranilate isomerase
MTMRVKICGVKTPEDALMAAKLGAWAIGFNFYPKSPRHIEPTAARAVIARLPASVAKIGLFVNTKVEHIQKVQMMCKLDLIQLSGNESLDYCKELGGRRIIKAFRPDKFEDLPDPEELFFLGAVLIDAPKGSDGLYGGTGRLACREFCKPLQDAGVRVILAGGITPENVRAICDEVHPWAIDVASGVESAPGVKDPAKMKALFAALDTYSGE